MMQLWWWCSEIYSDLHPDREREREQCSGALVLLSRQPLSSSSVYTVNLSITHCPLHHYQTRSYLRLRHPAFWGGVWRARSFRRPRCNQEWVQFIVHKFKHSVRERLTKVCSFPLLRNHSVMLMGHFCWNERLKPLSVSLLLTHDHVTVV